jgi:hypothetical protein
MRLARFAVVAVVLVGTAGCGLPIIGAQSDEPRRDNRPPPRGAPPSGTWQQPGAWQQPGGGAQPGVQARAHAWAAHTSTNDCYGELARRGVAFETVPPTEAPGVQMPLRLRGPVGGIAVGSRAHRQVHEILDCRLAMMLVAWAPTLQHAGVTGIEHFSMYRPGARTPRKRKVSGHARGLALDAARMRLSNGAVIEVQSDWEERERGGEPCPDRPYEAWPSRLLRNVVCDAVARGLFQVVLTPHHDKAHQDHVHLEVKPDVDWTYVR